MPFDVIVMIMESKKPLNKSWKAATFLVAVLCLSVTSVSAETYRWKDKDGKVHYGSTVPAEYADQPYDILNKAGFVIEHVEDSTIPQPVKVEEEVVKKKEPLISDEERQIQTDRLLVIQYTSEEEIHAALELELAQLGYDTILIRQSQESTSTTIREQIRLAANQQRANMEITADQQNNLKNLYNRLIRDEKRLVTVNHRKQRIRDRFEEKLERYRYLTAEKNPVDEEQTDQG